MIVGIDPGLSGAIAGEPPPTRAEARQSGARFYCTGKPCSRGHTCERWTNNGHCTTCVAERNAANASLECERSRQRRLLDPTANRDASRRWRERNPDAARESARLTAKRLRSADPIKHRIAVKQWRASNPEKCREMKKSWRDANPDRVRSMNRNRRALERKAPGKHTAADIHRIFLAQRGRCGYCRQKAADRYHIDHIIPLSRGGCNWPRNLQLLCAACNMAKHTADPIHFARQKGLLL